jgi:hypothetical protein
MNGTELLLDAKRRLKVSTDRALAASLGITEQTLQNWKKRRKVTTRQMVGLLKSASRAGARNFQAQAIRPIVEFYPLKKVETNRGGSHLLFDAKDGRGGSHAYRRGLRNELAQCRGVYVFFDSRGQAIYVGKARRQFLWGEMNLAFNRDRGEIQKIRRVRHPSREQNYRTSDQKARQISEVVVPIHELAAYFSAYQVAEEMVSDLEAMLVRCFANNLLNIRMERFARSRKAR